ncbi:MAG: hypothetical protein IT458_17020 [Planctomycetes bacterium]|nr:hypothetical protein [Planctomycetota bacterium]
MHKTILTALSLALLGGASLSAQFQRGDPAPTFKVRKAFNNAPTNLADARGKVVLLEFFATW